MSESNLNNDQKKKNVVKRGREWDRWMKGGDHVQIEQEGLRSLAIRDGWPDSLGRASGEGMW